MRFIWIGDGYDPERDTNYSVYLADQIKREGLEDCVFLIEAVDDLSAAYAAADIFLLTSRLDPLPNVMIDALCEALPVVCFEKGNGFADILSQGGLRESCVARGMDVGDMADKVLALATSEEFREQIGARSAQIAEHAFNMKKYVGEIEALALQAIHRTQQERADVSTITEASTLRFDYCVPPGDQSQTEEGATRAYVRAWAAGMHRRKPFPGFHPGIYLEESGVRTIGADPLADFIRRGRPDGPWISPVVTPMDHVPPIPSHLRVALHIHVYYQDLFQEIIDAILVNRVRPDLLISVAHEGAKKQICGMLSSYTGGSVRVRVVPNRGRDLGPLLTEFRDVILREYDVIGHLHTKKSADVSDSIVVRNWFRFLMENLGGGKAKMADIIIGTLAEKRGIGMIFPDDPNVVGWGSSRTFAERLARAMGIARLPEHFNFPVGSMFWADVAALKALFDLGLQWSDYPQEPLPYDGTMLHGIERLLSLAAVAAGKKIALTNVPGVTR